MVTGLDIIALEVFEQDMVGVKGYDAAILDRLTRDNVRIVSKVSNANTITHYVDTSLKVLRRVEADLAATFPHAEIATRRLALVSVLGRDLGGLRVLSRGLGALEAEGLALHGATQGPRSVDAQFVLDRKDRATAIRALHEVFIGQAEAPAMTIAA